MRPYLRRLAGHPQTRLICTHPDLAGVMLSLAVSSLAFQAPGMAIRPAVQSSAARMSVFENGMETFKSDFPWLAKYGFGPSVKAERWNGRHAMFG